jgi:peptidoglycan/LPS O-acetylase OafA/YrhL
MSAEIKNWTVEASSVKHLDVLDGLRGVAILFVVSFHGFYTNPEHGSIARGIGYLLGLGRTGVPIFFVLSGFLISYPFFKNKEETGRSWYPSGYASRRIGKIIPPFYLSIVLFMLFYWARFHDADYVASGLKWAVGFGNFIAINPEFNGPYWSLIVELQFYILLPLLFWMAYRLNTRQTTIVLFLLLVFVPFAVRQLNWSDGIAVYPDIFCSTRFPCSLDYFAWGIAFAGVYVFIAPMREKLSSLSLFGYLGGSLLLGTFILFATWSSVYDIKDHATRWSAESYHWLSGLSAFLLLFFVFDPDSLGARMLSSGWLRFTGLVSYEWFLFHYPIILWFQKIFGQAHGNIFIYLLKTVVPTALTFVFAAAVYRWFSLPILNRIRNRSRSKIMNVV